MRLMLGTRSLVRPADTAVSDLTGSARSGPAEWEEDGRVLVIPFEPEPSPAEQVLIRRRLMTRDAAHEAFVGALTAEVDQMATDTPTARAVRLLAAECLRGIDHP